MIFNIYTKKNQNKIKEKKVGEGDVTSDNEREGIMPACPY